MLLDDILTSIENWWLDRTISRFAPVRVIACLWFGMDPRDPWKRG